MVSYYVVKIAKNLGLCDYIIQNAYGALSEEKIEFERILQNAEKLKRESVAELEETRKIKDELLLQRAQLNAKQTQLDLQFERIRNNATAETKRLVSAVALLRMRSN